MDFSAYTGPLVHNLVNPFAISIPGLETVWQTEQVPLTTGSGNDVVSGGAQVDTINTGAGDDSVNARTRLGFATAASTSGTAGRVRLESA